MRVIRMRRDGKPHISRILSMLAFASFVVLAARPNVAFADEEELQVPEALVSTEILDDTEPAGVTPGLEPQQFPGDWDVQQWSLTSLDVFYYSPGFVLQADPDGDPEFWESRVGVVWPLHMTLSDVDADWRQFFSKTGIMVSLGAMSSAIRQFATLEYPWQVKYLMRIPAATEGFAERFSWAVHVAQNVSTVQSDWALEHQFNVRVADATTAFVRFQYSDYNDPRWVPPLYGVNYISEF